MYPSGSTSLVRNNKPPSLGRKDLFRIEPKSHGTGPVLFSWHPDGTYLATSGTNKILHIYDRSGAVVDEVVLNNGVCLGLAWDNEGELLAVIQANSAVVILWDKNTRKSSTVDMDVRDHLTWIQWSKKGPQLAIGTAYGSLLFYNKRTHRKTPFVRKHNRRITCGAWNKDNMLALADEGKQISLSNEEGETIESTVVKSEPFDLTFGEMKMDNKAGNENTISIDLGHKTIYLYNLNDKDNPIELAFQPKYGNITSYKWFGDGNMMLGFSAGFFVVISTHIKEIGQELFSHKFFTGDVCDVTYNGAIHKAAICGDGSIRICDANNWKNATDVFTLAEDSGKCQKVAWTSDGQILTVSTVNGYIFNFLTRLPPVHASCEARWAQLVSLQQVSVVNGLNPSDTSVIDLNIEPAFIALGPDHIAAGLNNQLWYYKLASSGKGGGYELVSSRDYLGSVEACRMNSSYVVVLAEGRVQMHKIQGPEEDFSKMFPEKEETEGKIRCIALTSEFFIYGTSEGHISYFYLPDLVTVNTFRHSCGIRQISSNTQGTRLIFVDENHAAFIYNPVNDQTISITPFSSQTTKVMWDAADWGVFVTADHEALHTYTFVPTTVSGPVVRHIGSTIMVGGLGARMTMVNVTQGIVVGQEETGVIHRINLASHEHVSSANIPQERLRAAFQPTLKLNRLKDALDLAVKLKDESIWVPLGNEALRQLNVELAKACFRQAGDAGMVLALQKIESIEETNLLAGHVNVLFADYSEAQRLFLSSTRPLTALEMRRDLLQWEQALTLAKTLAPDQLGPISREYAQQLEFKGEYPQAHEQYQRAQQLGDALAFGGVVRTTLRLGDIAKAMSLLQGSKDTVLLKECAVILENVKQFMEAAQLYERAQLYDKAVSIYLRTKNYNLAAPLMSKITSPKLHCEYAKAKEDQGNYAEAEKAYMLAKDVDNVIRLNLDHLKNPEKAFDLVRQTRTAAGARMAAKYCQNMKDFTSAIEFMLLAKLPEEAFLLAQTHDQMDKYAEILGDKGTPEQYNSIAHYYESRGDLVNAGTFYAHCRQFQYALKLFIQAGEPAIERAIEVIGEAKSETLVHQLLDYLMGDSDGIPKDPNYIFRLYMALGNFAQAAKTAVIIARSEQELGNYKVAHSILFDTHKSLESHNIKLLFELKRSLLVLHSYVLAKVLVKNKLHKKAARVLMRVSRNISKFPSHTVPILTLTVIECHRAGLKKSSLEFAAILMRPEYRNKIDAQYKRKIENIVRKPDRTEADEKTSPCPNCRAPVPKSELDCVNCKASIPYCIASGRHLVLDGWSSCPACKFPAIYRSFAKLVETEKACPMCDQPLEVDQIVRDENPFQSFKRNIENVEPEAASEQNNNNSK